MKHLFRIMFVVALFCGFAPLAHAQRGVDFHVQVLDPNVCISDPSICIILDASAPTNVSLDALACQVAGVPNLPSDSSTYGCAILFNFTLPPETITSLNLTFSGLDGLTFECDTKGITGSIFTQSSCGSLGAGTDAFSFYNGSFPFFSEAVIYETGVDPDLFKDGSASVNQPPITVFASEVPEPNSMLLLSTGVTMAGAYLTKQRRRFAKK
jgi:hypothetical protein